MKDLRSAARALLASALVCSSACFDISSSGGGLATVATVVPGSGNLVEEDRTVSGFTGVSHESEGALHVEPGAVEALRVRAEANLLPYLITVVEGGTLHLRTAPNVDIRPTQTIEYFLTVTSLEQVDFRGVGSIDVSDLTTSRLTLTRSGIGQVVLSNLTATELQAGLAGIGDLQASGSVDMQTVTLGAFSGYEAAGL